MRLRTKAKRIDLNERADKHAHKDQRDYLKIVSNLWDTVRNDEWFNSFTGLGDENKDSASQTSFIGRPRLNYLTLDKLYSQSPLAKRICDIPAWDATRKWIKINTDNSSDPDLGRQLLRDQRRLAAQYTIQNAIAWSRCYGGALVLIGTDEPKENFREPLKSFRKIRYLRTYDKNSAFPLEYNNNESSRNFGKPITYQLQNNRGRSGTFIVHHSRVLRFDAIKLPDRVLANNDGWPTGIIDLIFAELRAYAATSRYVENVVKDYTQDVFQVSNLQQLLASEDTEQIRERFRIIQMGKSILNAVIYGKDEHYEKRSTNVSGLAEVWEQFQYLVGSAAGIPLTRLFMRSPAGMNATGESDENIYDSGIVGYQESDLRPELAKLIHAQLLQKDGPTGGEDPGGWSFEFNPLKELSRKELAEVEKLEAETDSIRIADEVVNPLEVRKSRYNSDEGSIVIDAEWTEQMEMQYTPAPVEEATNLLADPDAELLKDPEKELLKKTGLIGEGTPQLISEAEAEEIIKPASEQLIKKDE